jgi:hypothetical protein
VKVSKKFEFMALSARGWLDELYTDANRVPASHPLRDDLAKAMRWLGLRNFSDIKQEHYELWSAGFVCYLAEGKAPPSDLTSDLKGPMALGPMFEAHAKWAREDPPPFVALDDDIRGVFRRLLAGDAKTAVPHRPSKGLGFLRSLFGFQSR